MYSAVKKASRAAETIAKPGTRCRTMDRAARNIVVNAGYGKNFIHALGHGIGREVHEPPYLNLTGNDRLRSGMVFTVEPGVYLPGVGGVRIEDDLMITSRGCRKFAGPASSLEKMILT